MNTLSDALNDNPRSLSPMSVGAWNGRLGMGLLTDDNADVYARDAAAMMQ